MKKATEAQTDVVTALPSESHEWDVYVGMHHAILDIQVITEQGRSPSVDFDSNTEFKVEVPWPHC